MLYTAFISSGGKLANLKEMCPHVNFYNQSPKKKKKKGTPITCESSHQWLSNRRQIWFVHRYWRKESKRSIKLLGNSSSYVQDNTERQDLHNNKNIVHRREGLWITWQNPSTFSIICFIPCDFLIIAYRPIRLPLPVYAGLVGWDTFCSSSIFRSCAQLILNNPSKKKKQLNTSIERWYACRVPNCCLPNAASP